MPVHWTDYPERVETFGDLLSVLETLDRHDMEAGFTAPDFQKGRGRRTAYKVDSTPSGWQLFPDLDQMLGLERLLDRFDIDGHPTLTHAQARELRRRAAKALNCEGAALNAKTFTEVVTAIDTAEHRLTQRASVLSQPAPEHPASGRDTSGIRTFGEFLADVQAVEIAAGQTRAMAEAMNGEPGSGHFFMQAAMFEATAAHKDHPAFHALEAHVNRLYGPFTYANLLRVRGEVCSECNCGTADADRLTVEKVVAALGCPGAHQTSGANVGESTPAPTPDGSTGQLPVIYTMGDIRDLLRYKREVVTQEELSRSTFKPTLTLQEHLSRQYSMAFSALRPARLSEERANTLAVYRRLLRESLTVLNKQLDEQTLLYFVGDVADRHKRPMEEMWPLSAEEFGRLIDAPVNSSAPAPTPTEVAHQNAGGGTQEPSEARRDRKLTDRQKLILTEMLAIGAVGNTRRTTRDEVVGRIDKKKTGADFARDFGILKEVNYTDSGAGPDGGVWLTAKGKTKAEELNEENAQ